MVKLDVLEMATTNLGSLCSSSVPLSFGFPWS